MAAIYRNPITFQPTTILIIIIMNVLRATQTIKVVATTVEIMTIAGQMHRLRTRYSMQLQMWSQRETAAEPFIP